MLCLNAITTYFFIKNIEKAVLLSIDVLTTFDLESIEATSGLEKTSRGMEEEIKNETNLI